MRVQSYTLNFLLHMKAVEFLQLGKEILKMMSNCDLRINDYKYIEMYDEYARMRVSNEKVDYILKFLSDKYKVSESTVKRVIRRLSREVKG